MRKRSGEWAWLLGPVAVCLSTGLVVHHATGQPISPAGMALFLFGVVAAYSLDRWNDRPNSPTRGVSLILSGLSSIAGFVAMLWMPGRIWALAALLGLVSLAYRGLKKIPLAKTLLVAAAWTGAGIEFPVQWTTAPASFPFPLAAAMFAVFAAGALLCDFKDVVDDAKKGVRTAPVLWGRNTAGFVAIGLAGTGIVAALSAGRFGLAASALALGCLAACPRILARPVLGPALVDSFLALPAVLILAGLV